ncbi:MAG: hypothetical protein ACFE8C_10450 [Promethearchaeota archaeon]
MRKTNKILFGLFVFLMIFTIATSISVVAVGPPDQTVEVPGDTVQTQLQANIHYMLRFRQRTQLRFNANVNLDLNAECEALRIGEKEFLIEIEGENDLEMNMTCTREEEQLGLMMGSTHRIRNRNTYRYQEGFVCSIDCNGTMLKARLRIQATNQNRLGKWAYYDEANEAWVTVPTSVIDGYLTAEVDHFSTWTILMPDYTVLIVGVIIGVVAALIIIASVIYIKKRK